MSGFGKKKSTRSQIEDRMLESESMEDLFTNTAFWNINDSDEDSTPLFGEVDVHDTSNWKVGKNQKN